MSVVYCAANWRGGLGLQDSTGIEVVGGGEQGDKRGENRID
jgi:hypothetical protein